MTCTDVSEELQVLADGERREENVVLRTETQRLTHAVHAAPDVVAVNQRVAAARLQEACGETPKIKVKLRN